MPQPSLSTYHPSLGERLQQGFAGLLGRAGVDPRYANHLGERLLGFANDLTPVGNVTMAADAGTAIRNGHTLQGLGMGALAVLPGAAKGMFGRGVRHLGSPSQLNIPRVPTAEEVRRLAQVKDVPLAQARHGNKLEWGRFGSGEPLVAGYSDKPLAAQLQNGEFVLFDGNHRAALAKHGGASDMQMYVIPAQQYDPANAGRAPAADLTDLDALLAELRRP